MCIPYLSLFPIMNTGHPTNFGADFGFAYGYGYAFAYLSHPTYDRTYDPIVTPTDDTLT